MTSKRNMFSFGIGTIGRDMVYSLISMYLIFYLTDVINLPTASLWWVTAIIFGARIFDAANDPFMGLIVDNTHTKYGKFKPWIGIGGFASGILTIILFTDLSLTGSSFIIVFSIIYLLWGIGYTANDISYWSMLPSLSFDQREREKIGAFARLCANIGLFTAVAGIVPLTSALGEAFGSLQKGYFVFTVIVVVIMWIGLLVTLLGVKEPKDIIHEQEKTKLKELLNIIFKNDQLLVIAIAMGLFMIGYVTTTSFGLYFFKYAYKDESVYSIFALVLGASQITALLVFPYFGRRFSRKIIFSGAVTLVILGYVLFFFSPMNMIYIGTSGIFLFVGQAFIQLLMLMFLADTVDYGHWKFGKRNESITFSLQPFINKIGGAAASGVVGVTVILSGISEAESVSDVTTEGLMLMKSSMLIIPLILILISFFIYLNFFRIDKKFYDIIISDLTQRGEITLPSEV